MSTLSNKLRLKYNYKTIFFKKTETTENVEKLYSSTAYTIYLTYIYLMINSMRKLFSKII